MGDSVVTPSIHSSKNNSSSRLSNSNESSRAGTPNSSSKSRISPNTSTKIAKDREKDLQYSNSVPTGAYFTELKDSSQPNRKFSPVNHSSSKDSQTVSPLYFQINRSESDEYYDPRFAQRSSFVWRFLNSCLYGSHSLTPETLLKEDNNGGFGWCGCSCLDYISPEVLVILLLYIVNKAGQEMAVSSIPSLTQSLFHWGSEGQGYYMALMGAMVLPSNILVSLLVKDVEDRDLVLRLTYVCMLSISLMLNMHFLSEYSLVQYVLGNSILFSALNSMEGIIMSLVLLPTEHVFNNLY